jgi:hypothetical protein
MSDPVQDPTALPAIPLASGDTILGIRMNGPVPELRRFQPGPVDEAGEGLATQAYVGEQIDAATGDLAAAISAIQALVDATNGGGA